MEKKTVIEMDYSELEELVQEFYGLKEWSFCADQEMGNDSSWTTTVEKEELDEWGKEKVEELKAGKFPSYAATDIMTDLCNHGKLKPGYYLIQVCW